MFSIMATNIISFLLTSTHFCVVTRPYAFDFSNHARILDHLTKLLWEPYFLHTSLPKVLYLSLPLIDIFNLQCVLLPPPPPEVHGSTTLPGTAWGTQMSLLELTVEEIKIPSEMEVAPTYRLLIHW